MKPPSDVSALLPSLFNSPLAKHLPTILKWALKVPAFAVGYAVAVLFVIGQCLTGGFRDEFAGFHIVSILLAEVVMRHMHQALVEFRCKHSGAGHRAFTRHESLLDDIRMLAQTPKLD